MARITEILSLALVVMVLVPGHGTALVTDFDFTAGYLRDGQYGNLYAKLTEQQAASSDSTLSPIGRNRPGKASPASGRRLRAPAPLLLSPARSGLGDPARCRPSD